MQYILIFLFAILTGYIFSDYIIVKKARKYHSIGRKKGYHIHHSTYGLVCCLVAPFIANNIFETIFFMGFGLGIIIEHTLHERFVFIEKENKK